MAMCEAERAGIVPAYFRDPIDALESLSYSTLGVVASLGRHSYFYHRYEGLILVEAADVMGIPKAVFSGEGVDDTVSGLLREDDGIDVILDRSTDSTAEQSVRNWISRITAQSNTR